MLKGVDLRVDNVDVSENKYVDVDLMANGPLLEPRI